MILRDSEFQIEKLNSYNQFPPAADAGGFVLRRRRGRMNKLSLEMLTAEDTPLTSIKLGRKDDLDDLNLSGTKLASVDISGCSRQLEAVTDTTWPYTVSKGVIYWDGSDAPLTINTITKMMKGKKVLFTYAKPKTFKFTKASVTLKRGTGDSLCIIYLSQQPQKNCTEELYEKTRPIRTGFGGATRIRTGE